MISALLLSACLSGQVVVVEPLVPFPVIEEAEKKAAVPQDIEPGMKRVREAQGAALARAKTPYEKLELAQQLATLGLDEKEEPAARWAALFEAARVAAEADNLLLAFWILDAQARLFETDLGKQRLALLRKVAHLNPAPLPASFQGAAKAALIASRDAEQSSKSLEDYDTVQALADLAVEFATKGKDTAAREGAQKYRDSVKLFRKDFEDAQAAKSKLESAPEDVEANRTWGKHLALNRLAWDKGLPFLAKGDGPLAEAARADQARQDTPEIQEATGNRWWKLADTDKKLLPREISALRMRAGTWYRQALPRAIPAGRTRMETKLKNVPAPPASLARPLDPDALKPGLMVRMYPRQAQQKGNRFISLEQMGEPVGKPTTARTLETFANPGDFNMAAFGYLRIDNPGSFYFHSPNHAPALILVDGRAVLPVGGGKSVTFRFNRKGYVPIVIIGYVDTGEIHLEWLSDEPVRPVPPSVFHDPERTTP